jgi:hypothetical protein
VRKLFYVNTFICRPDKKINDLSFLKNIESYFVPITDTRELLDFEYLSGAILFKYGEQILLDVTLWDLVDQLWAYILNVLESLLRTGKGETYFPDQPIKLQINSISEDLALYEIETNDHIKVVLPKRELVEALLQGGLMTFFKVWRSVSKRSVIMNMK